VRIYLREIFGRYARANQGKRRVQIIASTRSVVAVENAASISCGFRYLIFFAPRSNGDYVSRRGMVSLSAGAQETQSDREDRP
jgi:hypothetical protein